MQVIDHSLSRYERGVHSIESQNDTLLRTRSRSDLTVWILADSGLVCNLIDESVYNRLPFRPPIRDPDDVQVIGGNCEALDLNSFAVLPVSLCSNLILHELGVVLNLPLEVLIGDDVLAPPPTSARSCT